MNRMHEFPSRVTTTGSPFVPCSARKTKVSGRNRTRERGIVYQILEYRYREQKSQLFPSNPLQPLRNFLETSLSKHCSHYFASIYANIIERNEEKFEIFRIYFSLSNWILKKHLSICWNVSTCIAHRSENSINFHQVSTYRQFTIVAHFDVTPNYRGGDKKREYGFKFCTKLFNRILCGRRPLGALR